MGDTSYIKDHLQKLAVLKTEANRFEVEGNQLKKDFQVNLHYLYTNISNCKEPPKFLSDRIQREVAQYENTSKEIANSSLPLKSEVLKLETEFLEASNFSTKTITKYLACVLTERTGRTWLPIRYLLEPGNLRIPQHEAYAVITAESLFNLPNMGDTMTLLKTPYYVSENRYGIKYTESQHKDSTYYEKFDSEAFTYIWQMSSYNFISIADTPQFNAFFNLNKCKNKPFLHIPLSVFEQKVLRSFDEKLPTYLNYNKPRISPTHPRAIATQVLTDLVNGRLNQKERTTTLQAQREA